MEQLHNGQSAIIIFIFVVVDANCGVGVGRSGRSCASPGRGPSGEEEEEREAAVLADGLPAAEAQTRVALKLISDFFRLLQGSRMIF